MFSRLLSFLVIAAALASCVDSLKPPHSAALPVAVTLAATAEPLPLAQEWLGDLRFLGAIRLRAASADFGAISALAAGPDGFLSVSDTGNWLAFATVEAGDRLTGVTGMRMAPIPGLDGQPAPTKSAGDAEALVWDPASGTAQVSYEQQHRIMHFTGQPMAMTAVRDERLTAQMGWPANSGGEAMVRLPGGARIIIAETLVRPDGSRRALLTRGAHTRSIGVDGVAGFSPVDAVVIDGRHILVLHRRFTPLERSSAITMVDLGPVLDGRSDLAPARLLARWGPPLVWDNFEGMAVRHKGERTFIYIISDDNLSALQATILMKLELPADVISAGGAPSP